MLGVSGQVRTDNVNIQEGSDRELDAKTRTSSIFPGFLDCSGFTFLLLLHPTHGFLDRFEVIPCLLCALEGLVLEASELVLEGLQVVDGRNGIRRVSDEGGG